MKHGTYVGPLAHLRGKKALLREATHGAVVAQFDDRKLTRSGGPIPRTLDYEPHARFPTLQDFDDPPPDALGFGWHAFPARDFEEIKS